MRKDKWLISFTTRHIPFGEMKDDYTKLGGLVIGTQLAEPIRAPS